MKISKFLKYIVMLLLKQFRKNKRLLIIFLFFCYVMKEIFELSKSDFDEETDNYSTSKFHLILEFTKIFSQHKFCDLSLNRDIVEKFKINKHFNKIFKKNLHSLHATNNYNQLDNCKYKNCFFTCDKKYLNEANALIFHDADLYYEWTISPFLYNYLFKTRKQNQLWIYWNDEPNIVNSIFDKFQFKTNVFDLYNSNQCLNKKLFKLCIFCLSY